MIPRISRPAKSTIASFRPVLRHCLKNKEEGSNHSKKKKKAALKKIIRNYVSDLYVNI